MPDDPPVDIPDLSGSSTSQGPAGGTNTAPRRRRGPSRTDYAVTLPQGSCWPPNERVVQNPEWQRALQEAKRFGQPSKCMCIDAEAPLYVFQRARLFYLARYPFTGHQHLIDCSFYDPPPATSGQIACEDDVVADNDDGTKRLRLNFSLGRQLVPGRAASQPGPPRADRPGERKREMSIVGLLHFLWVEGDLTTWHPRMSGKRNWAVVKRQLDNAATTIVQRRLPLSHRLIVVPAQAGPNLKRKLKEEVDAKVAWATSDQSRTEILLFVGELVKAADGKHAVRLILSHSESLKTSLYCTPAFWERSLSRFPEVARLDRVAMEGPRVIAMFAAEVRRRFDGAIIGDITAAAFLVTTEQFIPYSSSFEYSVADKLVRQSRWFEKPLRYDAAEDVVLPDFVLFDTAHRHLPMEVYGRCNDEDYRLRRDEKRQLYARNYGAENYWEWLVDPSNPFDIPPFPSKLLAER